MPFTGDENVCPKFQPNIFNSARCHECLRLKHLHTDTPTHTPEQVDPVSKSSSSEEKEQSTKEDSDEVSVVSGGSLCILSSECDLYVCDGDESEDEDEHTFNSQCEGDLSSSSSFSLEEDEHFFSLPLSRMTRLDPPPHRNNSQPWMEEARNRDSFARRSSVPHVSSKVDQDREHGYFSLGRVTGARTLSDKSASPHRHAERGHPLPSNQTPEPKATIPFRNPDLGVPSQRRTTEIQNPDLAPVPLNSSPEPVDLSIQVEAQAGPRSLSPTPFKQAESLAATHKKGFRASNSSSSKLGNFFSPKQDSGFSSSSYPSRSSSPFKRTQPVSSLTSRGYGMDGISERQNQQTKSPKSNSFGHPSNSESCQKNLRTFASTVNAVNKLNKSQASPYADLRAGLRKTEPTSGRGSRTRSPSPARRSHDRGGQSLFRKTETKNFSHNQKKGESRNSSPSRISGQSILHKVAEGVRSASPVRKGYGTARQQETSLVSNRRSRNSISSSPSRRNIETSSQSLQKSEDKGHSPQLRPSYDAPTKQTSLHKTGSDQSSHSRSPSPSKRGYDPPGQSHFHKSESSNRPGSNQSSCKRSPSPLKRGYDPQGQSHFHKSERSNYSGSNRSSSSRSPSPSKRGYDPPGHSHFRSEHRNYSGSNRSSSSRSPSPSKRGNDPSGHSHFRSEHRNYSGSNRSSSSRSPSPSKQGYNPPSQSLFRSECSNLPKSRQGQAILHKTLSESRIDSASYTGIATAESWQGSTYSLHSPPISRNYSPSRKCSESKQVGARKPAHVSWSTGNRRKDQDYHSPVCHNRSPSLLMRNLTSSQSSIDSIMSSGSSGLNREEYAIMADLPKVKKVLQRASPNQMEGMERGTRDEMSLYKPASHSHTKPAHISWDDMMDQRGNPSSTHTPSHTQGNNMEEEKNDRVQQPDLLNFKKGWMSKLDESGEWKKHWFVLTDAGLKYYRDSGAEEKDELDGEIDLRSCLKVSEFDVEKNYGFQIQTEGGVFTLSAMTAGIRRNWIEVLRKNIRPSSTPDLTQIPDSSSDKENPRHQSSRRQSESSSTPTSTQRKFEYVELSPVATPSFSAPANQREAGEGQVREHSQGQEDKSRYMQRDGPTSRKWPGKTPEQKRLEEEIERKWEEFERLPLKPMASLSALGLLQREVASLTRQAEGVRGEGGVCVQGCVFAGGVYVCQCCSVSLEQMEHAHRHALEELQRKHQRQTVEMEQEKERLLNEETQATARAMEALRKAHKEELERVQKSKHLTTQTAGTHAVREQQQQELKSLRRELDGLSDRYSQKCLELNREQQNNGEKERQISMKEREIEQLRRQNQDLQSRLMEEIQRMRSFVTGQRSEEVIHDSNKGRSVCELEVLLRVKHNEVEYLHKEIMCLRNEVQFLSTEKQSVCVQYEDVCEELKVIKERSEQELQTLREHLRLAIAALEEERELHNSI